MPWLKFWLVVAGICLVIGYVSYRIGRDVIGVRLAEAGAPIREVSRSTPRQTGGLGTTAPGVNDTFGARPPLRPIVQIEPIDSPYGPAEEPEETLPEEIEQPGDEPEEDLSEWAVTEPQPEPEQVDSVVPEQEPAAEDEAATVPPPMERSRDIAGAGRYVVRVGSYANQEAAASQVAHLRELGYDAWMEDYSHEGIAYKRVFAARTATYDEAVRVQDRLQGQNIVSLVFPE